MTENNLTLQNLFSFFEKKKCHPILQEDENQIHIQVKIENVEFPLFFRIPESDLLQLLVFFPCNMKEGCEAETARTLHLLNKELDIPGFGMDDLNGLIFYRYMIPCPNKMYHPQVVDRFFEAIPDICASFFPLISSISQGRMKYKDISSRYDQMIHEEQIKENKQEEASTCP